MAGEPEKRKRGQRLNGLQNVALAVQRLMCSVNLHEKCCSLLCAQRSSTGLRELSVEIPCEFIMCSDLFTLVPYCFLSPFLCVCVCGCACMWASCRYLQRCLSLRGTAIAMVTGQPTAARTRHAICILWPHPVAGSPPVVLSSACLSGWQTYFTACFKVVDCPLPFAPSLSFVSCAIVRWWRG